MPKGSGTNSPAHEADSEAGIVRHLTERLHALGMVPPVAVAVSGGGDSVALARLVRAAAPGLRLAPADILAVTVDHGLRPGSALEAATVGGWMRALGFHHEILTWKAPPAGPGLQAAARQARYGLLLHWCIARRARTLLTAHTEDDQAETVLMRLARGSGVDGLSGIAPVRLLEAEDGGRVRLLRPLLELSRAHLREWLEARGAGWIEDPSNENPAFDRIRARHALRLLEPLGLSRARLAKTAAQMARARAALDAAARRPEAQSVVHDPAGFALFDPAALAAAPREIALRVFARALLSVSGGAYRPRLDRLERAFDALASEPRKARTLGGCRLVPQRDGRILVCREMRAAQGRAPLAPGAVIVWDGRFRLRLAGGAEAGEIGPLGAGGLAAMRGRAGFDAANVPPPARPALPCLYRGNEAVAAPHLGIVLPELAIETLEPPGDGLMRFPAPEPPAHAIEGWFWRRGTLS